MSNSSTSSLGPEYLLISEYGTTAVTSRDNNYFAGPISHQLSKRPQLTNVNNSLSAPKFQLTPIWSEVRKFAEALEPFTRVHEGWNGPESSPPTREAIVMALGTCIAIVNSGLPRPSPKIFSHGGLGGFWCSGRAYATMDFEDDGEHIWTVTDGTNYKSGTWKLGEALPKAIDNIAAIKE